MPKLRKVSGEEVVKILCNKFGFQVTGRKGSHVRLSKMTPEGKVGTVVPMHKELKIGTLRGILKLAKIDIEEFSRYLYYKMCSSPATLRFGAFALGQQAGITSFKLTVLYTKKIEIFGSYARGEQKEASDLDVIVEFKKRKSLLELVGIEQELEDHLGIKIDLLTEASISPYLKVILNE